ncbi:MAG TPA: peptidase E, partial [Trebonia sp.]|nr:peptidase E [Trebonia sp.]
AGGDDPRWILHMYNRFAGYPARLSHLALFPMPNVADPEDLLLSQDVIFVGGGSVANMVAVWRVHRIDEILRKAWQAGIVLAGSSAGGICWFEGGTTDSFGIKLRAFTDGLAMLPGSFCPHYHSEAERRPLYQRLVADGALPGGIACDDGTAAHFTDETLAEQVSDRPAANAYLVTENGAGGATETPLPVRFLGA